MIKPYYQNKLVTIYNGDCLDILPEIEQVDLVLTDPPYGIGICTKGGKKGKKYSVGGDGVIDSTDWGKQEWDYKPMSEEQKNMCIARSKNQIFFGGNYFNLPPSPCWIVWHKDNTGNFADCELAWTSFKTAVRYFKWRWNGMLQEDMKNKEIRVHPTQKPVPLFKWILENYSEKDELICDSFAGSGTCAIACMLTHRRNISIDKVEKYCEIAAKRCEQAKTGLTPAEQEIGQQTLFE